MRKLYLTLLILSLPCLLQAQAKFRSADSTFTFKVTDTTPPQAILQIENNTFIFNDTTKVRFGLNGTDIDSIKVVNADTAKIYFNNGSVYNFYSPNVALGGGGSGDITAVNVNAPVTGGGTSGAVTVGVDTTDATPTALATQNDIANFITTETGDIESVTAGTGLIGGGTTGAVTLNIVENVGGGLKVTADSVEVNYAELLGDSLIIRINTGSTQTIDVARLNGSVIIGTEIDTYGELNAIVADVTLTHNGLIDTFSELDAIVADKSLVNMADGATWLGVHDFGGASSVELPNGGTVITDVFGEIGGDNNAWDTGRGAIQVYDGTANTYLVGVLVSDSPNANQVPKFNSGGFITWEDDATGGGGSATADSAATQHGNRDFDKWWPVTFFEFLTDSIDNQNNKSTTNIVISDTLKLDALTASRLLALDANKHTVNTITGANLNSSISDENAVFESRQLTISGTTNEITSSAGAQDLSADRTWTLSLPTRAEADSLFPADSTDLYLGASGAGQITFTDTLDIGTNPITFSTGQLSPTDLEILDDGTITYSEMTFTNNIVNTDIAADAVQLTELDDDSNLPTAGDFIVVEVGDNSVDYLTPNAGSDLTADLEEETHATEHENGGADEINLDQMQGTRIKVDSLSAADSSKIAATTLDIIKAIVDTLDIEELTATPTNLPANTARMYAIDDNGITQVEVVDPDGIVTRTNRDVTRIIRNVNGGAITKVQAVYVFSGTGTRTNVKLAQSNALSTLPAIGVVLTSSIADNGFGIAITTGQISGVKTDFAGWAEGDVLYVDPSTPGALTNIEPTYPNYSQSVGVIEFKDPTNGRINVNVAVVARGAEDGSTVNTFTIGDQGAGTKSFVFDGTNNGTFSYNSNVGGNFALDDTLTVTGNVDATKVTGVNVTSGADPGHTHGSGSITEVDPNALLTAGTDNVKDTHIDWGSGAGQVNTDDIPEGTNKFNVTHTSEVTGATGLTVQPSAIGNRSLQTIAATDTFLVKRAADGALAKGKVTDIALSSFGGAVTDAQVPNTITIDSSAVSDSTRNIKIGREQSVADALENNIDHNNLLNFIGNEHIDHTAVSITISGTANQIISSAGAQDISASRTWTLSLPVHIKSDTLSPQNPTTNLTLNDTTKVVGTFESTGNITGPNVTSGADPGHTHGSGSITEADPTLTNDGAVTIGDGSSGDVTLTFDGDGGINGAIVWDVSEDEFTLSHDITTTAKIGIGLQNPTSHVDIVTDTTRAIFVNQTISDVPTTAVAGMQIQTSMTSTSVNDSTTQFGFGLRSNLRYGFGGVAAVGSGHASQITAVVAGGGHNKSEIAAMLMATRGDVGTGFTQIAGPVPGIYGLDFGFHTYVDVAAEEEIGLSLFGNKYSSDPPTGTNQKSVMVGITTKKGTGPIIDATHAAEDTYPFGIGLAVTGYSKPTAGTIDNGFDVGVQIGGTGSPWQNSVNDSSRIGKGVTIEDFVDAGIEITSPHADAAASVPAIAIASGAGRVGIGTLTPTEQLDVVGNISVSGTVDGVDIAARDHDAVTLAGTPDYITISGQAITRNALDIADDLNAFTSAQFFGKSSDETGGAGVIVGSSSPTIATPTFTTSATVPLVIGGTGTGSTLSLRSTSGVGATDAIIFQVGNNGATEAARFNTSGQLGIGTSTPGAYLDVTPSGSISGTVMQTGGSSTGSPLVNIAGTITGTSVANARGVFINANMNSSGNAPGIMAVNGVMRPAANIGTAYGVINNLTLGNSSSNITSLFVNNYQWNTAAAYSGTITTAYSLFIATPTFSGTKPTNIYGMRIDNQGSSGISNTVGLQINNQTGSTNNYSLVVEGGSSGFGTTTPTSTVHIDGTFSIGPESSFTLASNAATVTKANVILDTEASAALDTLTTLTTASVGDIVYISTANAARDIRILDAGNFSLSAEVLLDDPADVLVLKATTTTTWKQVSFSDNN